MAIADDVAQKIKGKGQKLKGRMDPDRVRGTIDEIKGTVNEATADMKLRTKMNRDFESEER
jgi:uncharacterized protein YjbJ (UPF0337 family)